MINEQYTVLICLIVVIIFLMLYYLWYNGYLGKRCSRAGSTKDEFKKGGGVCPPPGTPAHPMASAQYRALMELGWRPEYYDHTDNWHTYKDCGLPSPPAIAEAQALQHAQGLAPDTYMYHGKPRDDEGILAMKSPGWDMADRQAGDKFAMHSHHRTNNVSKSLKAAKEKFSHNYSETDAKFSTANELFNPSPEYEGFLESFSKDQDRHDSARTRELLFK